MGGCLRLIFAHAADMLSKSLALRDVQAPMQGHEESGLTIFARASSYVCSRYRRHSDKPRFAELFAASAELEGLYLGPEDDAATGSVQPVIRINSRGERRISLMRWGFKERMASSSSMPRAESTTEVSFWEKSFSLGRCTVPADSFLEWQKTQQGKKPNFEFTVIGPNSGRAGP